MAPFSLFSMFSLSRNVGSFPLLGILLVALSLVGCDNSKSRGDAGPSPVVVSSNVVKGVMSGADIALYSISNGTKGALITRTTSSTTGDFTLTIPGTESGPFLVEATSNSSTRLRCDVLAGCGTTNAGSNDDTNGDSITNFGEFYPSPTLTLTAVAANANAVGQISVTPLSHFVTRFAGSFPQGWDTLSIEISYSQLSNLFGLGTNMSALKGFDITQPSPVGVTLDQWHFALLNAAFAALAGNGPSSPELGSWIDSAADTFALQNGQLLARHDDNGALSAEDLATHARALAVQLNPAAEAFFARLQLLLQAYTPGQLTNAQPSPGIGNDTLANVNTFLDDWRTWRSDLPLHASGTPFSSTQADYQEHLQAQWTLTQVLASASQYAPYAAAPDLVLEQYCNSIQNAITRSLCQSLLANKTICLFGLAVNGEPLCEYLTHLPLPLNNGLVATVDIFAQTAQLTGTLNGQTINLWMVAEQSTTQQITMHISGSIESERYAWTLMDGDNNFYYTTPLSVNNFQLPDSLQSDITLNYSAHNSNGTQLTGAMHSKLNVELDPWRAIGWSSEMAVALPAVPMSLEMTGDFTLPYNGTGYVLIRGGSNHWLEFELPQQSSHNGLLAQVRLGGTLAQWESGLLNSKVSWDGHSLSANYTTDYLELQNAHGIRLVMPEGGADAGNLYSGSQRYGRLYREEDMWWVQLADNTEEAL